MGTFRDINKTVLVPAGASLTADITASPSTARFPGSGEMKVSLSQALKRKDDLCKQGEGAALPVDKLARPRLRG